MLEISSVPCVFTVVACCNIRAVLSYLNICTSDSMRVAQNKVTNSNVSEGKEARI
jgi:hypothetical protein